MHVQVRALDLLLGPRERSLVQSRAVGKTGAEEVVVAPRDLLDGLGEVEPLGGREVDEGA